MTPAQVAKTADYILDNYGMLKIDDFKLCFDMAVSGQFGEVYRLDVNVVVSWIEKYLNERINEAENQSFNEHNNIKAGEKREFSLLEVIQQNKIK